MITPRPPIATWATWPTATRRTTTGSSIGAAAARALTLLLGCLRQRFAIAACILLIVDQFRIVIQHTVGVHCFAIRRDVVVAHRTPIGR